MNIDTLYYIIVAGIFYMGISSFGPVAIKKLRSKKTQREALAYVSPSRNLSATESHQLVGLYGKRLSNGNSALNVYSVKGSLEIVGFNSGNKDYLCFFAAGISLDTRCTDYVQESMKLLEIMVNQDTDEGSRLNQFEVVFPNNILKKPGFLVSCNEVKLADCLSDNLT